MAVIAGFAVSFAFAPLQQAHAQYAQSSYTIDTSYHTANTNGGSRIASLQAQIEELLKIVKNLQKQLAEIRGDKDKDKDKDKDGDDEIFSATPLTGAPPLQVTFSSNVSGQGGGATIDFGDGKSAKAKNCSAPTDKCEAPGKNKHTYAKPGVYNATLTNDRTGERLGSVIIDIPVADPVHDCDYPPVSMGPESLKWQKECVDGERWGLSDIQKVTYKPVDPIPGAVDDEYTEYTVVLKRGGGTVVIDVCGFCAPDARKQAFIKAGYTGDYDDFFRFVEGKSDVNEKVDLKITNNKFDEVDDHIAAIRNINLYWRTNGVEDCELTRKYAGNTVTRKVSNNFIENTAKVHRINPAPVFGLDRVTLTCLSKATGEEISDSIKISFATTQKRLQVFVDGERVKNQKLITRERGLAKCLEIASDNRYDKVYCTWNDKVIFKKNNPDIPAELQTEADADVYDSESAFDADTDDVDEGKTSGDGQVQGASTTDIIESLKEIVLGLQTVAQLYSALR